MDGVCVCVCIVCIALRLHVLFRRIVVLETDFYGSQNQQFVEWNRNDIIVIAQHLLFNGTV